MNEKIIVKFKSVEVRNRFYNKTFSTRIQQHHIKNDPMSPSNNNSIFINQQLTNYNQKLFKKARDLKKEKRIFKAVIRDGTVAIKITEKDRYKFINNINDLEKLRN